MPARAQLLVRVLEFETVDMVKARVLGVQGGGRQAAGEAAAGGWRIGVWGLGVVRRL